MVGRGVDLETAVAVKDLALRMGNAAVYKEGGIAGEDYPNHLKLTDVDEASILLVFALANLILYFCVCPCSPSKRLRPSTHYRCLVSLCPFSHEQPEGQFLFTLCRGHH